MSQENVEVVRRWVDLGPGGQVRARVSDYCDPDIDYYPVRKFPEARPCHGSEELSRLLVEFREAFSRSAWETRWILPVGDDRVLACANLQAEGRGSGLELAGDVYFSIWLRHGRIFRQEDHLTLSGALRALGLEGETLEAVGLSEQDVP
jgi:hypothetical protein